MFKDTQRRIREYKAMLPGVKERIVAAALALIMSVAMLATTTYAWLTISRAPEAKGMSTTLSGNGNLEISLVPADGSLPGNSNGIFASLLESNVTWGNMVNLSDSRYGLDQIVLRPAAISGITPDQTPLQGATYGEDGRLLTTTDLYRFASYVLKDDGKMYFSADAADVGYGVRAITSVTYQNISGNAHVTVALAEARQYYADAQTKYLALIKNETRVSHPDENKEEFVGSMTALQSVMQIYVQEQADKATGGGSGADYSGVVTYTYRLIDAFLEVMQEEGEMLRTLANLQIYMNGQGAGDNFYETVDALVTAQKNNTLHSAVKLDGLEQFADDYYDLNDALGNYASSDKSFKELAEKCDPTKTGDKDTVAWSVIQPAVSVLVDIDNAEMDGMKIGTMAQQSKTTLIGIIMDSSVKNVVIYGGALREAEARIGAFLATENVQVKVGVSAYGMGPFTVKARVLTDVDTGIAQNTQGMKDYSYTTSLDNNSNSGDAVAQDTYGMAIDLWIRTNVSDVVLTLEGSLITKEVVATTFDKNGKETVVYVMATSNVTEKNVYRVQNDSVYTYYDAETHAELGDSETMTPMAGYSFKATNTKGENASGEQVDLYLMTRTETIRMDVYKIEAAKTWYDSTSHSVLGTNETLTREAGHTFVRTGRTGTNKNGSQVDLYTMSYPNPDTGKTETKTVYMTYQNADKQDVWYYDGSHIEIGSDTDMQAAGATFTEKIVEIVSGYDGVNRVWEDFLTLIDEGKMAENNTTQGGGSCYVFYADPSDQTRILQMLKAFTIVFVDQNGGEYGTAKLDTEHAFSINGKTTVPLMMITGTKYVDENGEEKTGITSLVQNEATRISAIVYLDGQYVGNEDVLAMGELQGILNIQFGSSTPLQNMDDTDLRLESREIHASATYKDAQGNIVDTSESSSHSIDLDYNGKVTQVEVTLTVTGEQPRTISGFFVRSINQSQGTRGETVKFDYQGGNIWKATFDLSRPGNYIMRNLIVDGTDYALDDGTTQASGSTQTSMDNFPTVKIAGLKVDSVYCTLNEGITMTADRYIDADVSVSINASADLMPKQVRALFRSTDGKEFTALLSNTGASTWFGTARINDSGIYKLEYIVVDGDYNPVEQENAYILYLGIRARVESKGILQEDGTYSNEIEFRGEAKTIDVQVTLYDNSNNILEGLEDVWLFYHSTVSSRDEHGMYGTITWNKTTRRYEGSLDLSFAGTFVFDRVVVNRSSENPSTVNQIKSAPTFTAYVVEPPVYKGSNTVETQFVPNGGAEMQIVMENADTASIWAEIQDQNGNTYMVFFDRKVANTQENNLSVYFKIPTNKEGAYSGKQDGDWKLVKLYMQGVAKPDTANPNADPVWVPITADGAAGQVPSASDCYVIDLIEESITSYVIHTIKVTITDPDGNPYSGETFGVDGATVTGKFMEAFTTQTITITVQDWQGKAIEAVTGVQWNRYYSDNSSKNYGGYTAAQSFKSEAPTTLNGSGTTYTLGGQTYQWAGTYTSQFTILAGDVTAQINGPSFAVHTNAPTVTISGANPANGSSVTDSNKASKTQNVSSHSATVYMQFEEGETVSGCSTVPTYTYTPSSVAIDLSGLGTTVTSAKITFAKTDDGTVHLYSTSNNSGTRTSSAVWSNNGTSTLFVGLGSGTSTTDGGCTVAGTLSATKLEIEYSNVLFTVDIPDITISNPS